MYKKAHLAGVAFASIFGLTFMFSKTALAYISPIGLIAYRFLLAFLVFEILRRVGVFKIRMRKDLMLPLILVGVFQPFLYFLFETYGLARTTSAEAGMMIALIPIFVSVFSSIILKERPTWLQMMFILLSVSGVIYIQLSQAIGTLEPEFLGYGLLFGAVLAAAAFNIASRSASRKANTYEITYFMMLFGAVSFNALYLIRLAMGDGVEQYLGNLANITLLLPIIYLGVVGSIGGFALLNYALGVLEAHVISIYANLATIVALIAGAVFLQETLSVHHYIGAVMIIVGVYGTIRNNRAHKQKPI